MALPMADRRTADLPGHWLLARLGKRVLRPGGRDLTEKMLADASLSGVDVVELAPGLGKTAQLILAHHPGSYTGVEFDDDAAALTSSVVGARGRVVRGEASATGLSDAAADVVVGEAMLTMQTDAHKSEVAGEVRRILRPGGRYAIHELALQPDDVAEATKDDIRKALARSIKVNARPLTAAEWTELLAKAGFRVDTISFAPMALLEPRRVIADEGIWRTMYFVMNVLRDSGARTRVSGMRSTFRRYRGHMAAVEIIATRT